MVKKLYFGNLRWNITEEELAEAVGHHGAVVSARIITDRETGRSRGFGFVEVEDADVEAVIAAMNGQDLFGRPAVVSEAREREPRQGGFQRGGYNR